MTYSTEIDTLLEEIGRKELRARRRALIYTLIPVVVAAVLIAWTAREVREANRKVEMAEQRVASLQQQADSVNKQLQEAAATFIDIAQVARDTESFIESKESLLRTTDEARFVIDLRMKFDSLNSELLKLSTSFPGMRTVSDNRKWVAVVKSSKDLTSLKGASKAWSSYYGASKVAIYRSGNGYYALAILGDGTFTQAYRLTVSLIRSGRATDAYFTDASKFGPNLISG